jgi:hypothetical protein
VTVLLLIAGVFSGPASTGTQPAAAAVIRDVENAIAAKPGTIVVSKYRVTGRWAGGRPDSFTIETVYETPADSGPKNSLYVTTERLSGVPSERAVSGGDGAVYVSGTNTHPLPPDAQRGSSPALPERYPGVPVTAQVTQHQSRRSHDR